MTKYIDLLTIGNLSPDILKILAPLRARYNIVSCRSAATQEIINSSKLILQQTRTATKINNEEIELPYLEDYIQNAVCTTALKDLDNYYTIAVNQANIHKLPDLLKLLGISTNSNIFLIAVPTCEFANATALPDDILQFVEQHAESIQFLFTELTYDYSRLIPAVRFMLENGLDDKTLVQLDLDVNYSIYAIYKLNRLINETDDLAITSAATPDVLFDCAMLSDKLTAIKPKYFTSLLWDGLRPMIMQNSSANYWHTFNLWVSNIYKGTYYCKFENVPIDNSIEFTNLKTKAFYNELARMGINKLLTEEVQYGESVG